MKQLGKVTQDKAQYGQVLKGLITQVGVLNKINIILIHAMRCTIVQYFITEFVKNVHLSLA